MSVLSSWAQGHVLSSSDPMRRHKREQAPAEIPEFILTRWILSLVFKMAARLSISFSFSFRLWKPLKKPCVVLLASYNVILIHIKSHKKHENSYFIHPPPPISWDLPKNRFHEHTQHRKLLSNKYHIMSNISLQVTMHVRVKDSFHSKSASP